MLSGYQQMFFTCTMHPLDAVCGAVREVLMHPSLNGRFWESRSSKSIRDMYEVEPPIGGRIGAALLVSSPLTSSDATVLVSNLGDGWITMMLGISRHLPVDLYSFALASSESNGMLKFEVLRSGVATRHVHLLHDSDGLVFFQRGDPHEFEDVSRYSSRRKRDRVSTDYVEGIAQKLGFAVASEEFWQGGASSRFFSEEPEPDNGVLIQRVE